MTRTRLTRSFATLTFVVVLAMPHRVFAQALETVVEWNRILQTTVASTPTPTVFFTRPYALTSVAVFDALNSIDRVYSAYLVQVTASSSASREAAVAQAAHDVLVALYPGQQATLDAALSATLSQATGDVGEGVRVGAAVARDCLEARRNDGWERQASPYLLPNLPGYYQVTPLQNATVTFTHYPDVTPFAIGSRQQFLMEAPPALSSERYAADFNEVKAVGGVNSTARTEEETSIARRWAGVNTSTALQIVWNNVVRDLSRRFGLSGLDAARAYALLNVAMHDALLTSFNGKFVYGLWRPVTAIREASRDGNSATEPDPNWLPLLPATPPYPSYPGNMACVAAASSRTLELVFGRDNIPLTVTWTGTGGAADITRSFNGFRHMADEESRSRVLGGIHYTFDQTASFGVCTPLADYVVNNYARRRF